MQPHNELTRSYFDGTATDEELDQLSREICDSEAARKKFIEDKHSLQKVRPMTSREQMAFLKVISRLEEKKSSARRIRHIAFAAATIAAAVVAAVFITMSIPGKVQLPDTEFCALAESSNTVILPDSSVVRLLGGARLVKYSDFSATNRKVHLVGEAVFDIKSDSEHPFEILMENDCKVKVYGTMFDLASPEGSDELCLTLLRGKVSIESPEMRCEVTPGESVRYSRSTGALSKTHVNVDDYQAWMDGNIEFTKTTLADLTERLEGIYGVSIVLSDNLKSKRDRYSISLNNRESLESLLEAIGVALPISIIHENGVVFITSK